MTCAETAAAMLLWLSDGAWWVFAWCVIAPVVGGAVAWFVMSLKYSEGIAHQKMLGGLYETHKAD